MSAQPAEATAVLPSVAAAVGPGPAPTLVVKIGSSSLSDPTSGCLDVAFMHDVSRQVGILVNTYGWRVLIVTSGAVACGVARLGLQQRPPGVAARQALAAIGQISVVAQWNDALRTTAGLHAAQLLLTHGDFSDRERSQNLMATLRVLFDWRVVPVVNENDPIATAELAVGDNDQLSALLALQVGAQALLLLTDIDGVYDSNPSTNPNAERLEEISVVTAELLAAAGGPGSSKGRGGMRSKLESARLAAASGVPACIAGARAPDVLLRAVLPAAALAALGVASGDVGTRVPAARPHVNAARRWLGVQRCPGRLLIDAGAVRAIHAKKSLLFVGITAVEGNFEAHDTLSIVDASSGLEVARGLAAIDSTDMARARGLRSDPARAALGGMDVGAAVHRDDLLLLSPSADPAVGGATAAVATTTAPPPPPAA